MIPKTLQDAITELERIGAAEPMAYQQFRDGAEAQTALYHHTLGKHIRNTWGLWQNSPLRKYFYALGIYHPDDMSGIILTSLWRHLHDLPIDLDAQVQHYKQYWEEHPPTCEI